MHFLKHCYFMCRICNTCYRWTRYSSYGCLFKVYL